MTIKFFQGTNGLSEKGQLPFADILSPGEMARSDDFIIVGNSGTESEKVVTGSSSDDWTAWTDITDSNTDPVYGVKIINRVVT